MNMESYITPKKILEMTFGKSMPNIPETVYIFFYKSLINKIEKDFELEKIKFTRGDFYIEKNKNFGIITNFGVGESTSLMLAEELAEVGVKRVIAVGAVGSLTSGFSIGDKVMIKSAISQLNIGKIYNYKKEEILTSKEQNKIIKNMFEKEGENISFVKTLSVPTIYGETRDVVERAVEKNASVIEMEIFSLALVFSLRKVSFSAIGCVSDVLSDGKWSFEDDFKKVFDSLREVFLKIQENL